MEHELDSDICEKDDELDAQLLELTVGIGDMSQFWTADGLNTYHSVHPVEREPHEVTNRTVATTPDSQRE